MPTDPQALELARKVLQERFESSMAESELIRILETQARLMHQHANDCAFRVCEGECGNTHGPCGTKCNCWISRALELARTQ